MLMPTCLKPYPGELLYGWIVRLFRVNMYDSFEKFCVAYIPYEDRKFKMKKPFPVRLDYRFNLDHICAENEEFECFPDIRCKNDTTCNPISIHDQRTSSEKSGNSAQGTDWQ